MPVLYSKFIFSFFRYTKNSTKKSMKITLFTTSKEKQAEKERARWKKEENKVMVVLLVFILATLEIALGGKKNCWTEENSGEMYKIVTGASD